MKIIKRNGSEVDFDLSKIETAIKKANDSVSNNDRLTDKELKTVVKEVLNKCEAIGKQHTLNVEDIQDIVENILISKNKAALVRNYITYRYERTLVRKANTTDEQILSLIERDNEEIKQENSNKNPIINSVQRDYMAGEVSKDLAKRLLLPKDVVEAHEQGIIHFHKSIVA